MSVPSSPLPKAFGFFRESNVDRLVPLNRARHALQVEPHWLLVGMREAEFVLPRQALLQVGELVEAHR